MEQYLTDWSAFRLGRRLVFSARITAATSSFDLGSAVVARAALAAADEAVVSVPLPGGLLGLRLVTSLNATGLPAAFELAVVAARVRNAGGNTLLFPRLALRCAASAAGAPGAERRGGLAVEAGASLAGAVTRYDSLQTVGRRVAAWAPRAEGRVLVCGVEEEDETNPPFYREGRLGLGVVTVRETTCMRWGATLILSLGGRAVVRGTDAALGHWVQPAGL